MDRTKLQTEREIQNLILKADTSSSNKRCILLPQGRCGWFIAQSRGYHPTLQLIGGNQRNVRLSQAFGMSISPFIVLAPTNFI